MLVAIDGSELSESALKAMGPWARVSGAEVVLLTVRQPGRIHETTSTTALHVMVPRGTPSGQSLPVRDAAPISAEDRTRALERTRTETEDCLRRSTAFVAKCPPYRADAFAWTARTGVWPLRMTSSATLPMKRRLSPERPCVAMTMRSTSASSA